MAPKREREREGEGEGERVTTGNLYRSERITTRTKCSDEERKNNIHDSKNEAPSLN